VIWAGALLWAVPFAAAGTQQLVLPIDVAISESAGVMAALCDRDSVCHVSAPDAEGLLEAYAAHMLAFHLRQRGVTARAVAYGAPAAGGELPQCAVVVARAQGATVFIDTAVVAAEGQRVLRTVAHDVASGEVLRSSEVPFHIPQGMDALGTAQTGRLSADDRRWLTVFDEMFPAPPQGEAGLDAAQRLASAECLFERGVWRESAELYLSARGNRPDRALARAAMAFQLAGRGEEALVAVESSLNRHADCGPLHALHGWLMLRQSGANDALPLLEQARMVDMAREGLYVYARGLVALETGDGGKAAESMRSAARLLPDALFAQTEAARLLWARGDRDAALEHYTQATRVEGAGADAWAELAVVLEATGRREEAIEALERACSVQSDSAAAVRHLALLLRQSGRHGEALEVLRKAAEANPCSASLLVAYGDGAAQAWQIATAEAQFRRALEVSPGLSYATVRLAHMLAVQRQYLQAEDMLTALLADQPAYAAARIELGRALGDSGRVEEALATLLEAAKEPQAEAGARIAMSRLHRGCGRHEEAIRDAQIAVSLLPNGAGYAELCEAFAAADQIDKAAVAASAALEHDPTSVTSYVALARVRLAEGEPDEALQATDAALELDPQAVEALRLAGTARQHKGEFRACAALWSRALELNPWDAGLHFQLSRLLGERLGEQEAALAHYARYLELERMRATPGQ
jgi:tetratricopeptide (TPR) repeat protein